MDKKLFDKCLSVVKNRIRKLTMDKSNIQIAVDNYKRDYEKALKQIMKLYGLDGEFTFNPDLHSAFGRILSTGSLVIRETNDMFAPYQLQFISTKKSEYVVDNPEFEWLFDRRSAEDIEKIFTEDILPYVVKEECAT